MDIELIDEPEVADVRIALTKAEFLKWTPTDGLSQYTPGMARNNGLNPILAFTIG